MENTEHIRLRIPVPPGKKLVRQEVRLLAFELDDPADANRLTIIGLADWVERKVKAAVGEQPAYVLLIELRPETPTTVTVRALLPTFE